MATLGQKGRASAHSRSSAGSRSAGRPRRTSSLQHADTCGGGPSHNADGFKCVDFYDGASGGCRADACHRTNARRTEGLEQLRERRDSSLNHYSWLRERINPLQPLLLIHR